MPTIPPTANIIYNSYDAQAAIQDKSGQNFMDFMRKYTLQIQRLYQNIANAFNRGADYKISEAQPTPDPGQLLVWKKPSTSDRTLLYNDNGSVYELGGGGTGGGSSEMPVGTVMLTFTNDNPASLGLPGTWESY